MFCCHSLFLRPVVLVMKQTYMINFFLCRHLLTITEVFFSFWILFQVEERIFYTSKLAKLVWKLPRVSFSLLPYLFTCKIAHVCPVVLKHTFLLHWDTHCHIWFAANRSSSPYISCRKVFERPLFMMRKQRNVISHDECRPRNLLTCATLDGVETTLLFTCNFETKYYWTSYS